MNSITNITFFSEFRNILVKIMTYTLVSISILSIINLAIISAVPPNGRLDIEILFNKIFILLQDIRKHAWLLSDYIINIVKVVGYFFGKEVDS